MKKVMSLALVLALMLSVMPVLPAAAAETETTAPVETAPPTEAETAPTEENTAPIEAATTPMEETTAPTEVATTSTEETTVPTEAATAPTEETAPVEETAASVEETMGLIEDGYAEYAGIASLSESSRTETINLGEEKTVSCSGSETIQFTFTPRTSGGYVLHTDAGSISYDSSYNGKNVFGQYGNGFGWEEYFCFKAGKKYIFNVKNEGRPEKKTVTVRMDSYVEPEHFSLQVHGEFFLAGSYENYISGETIHANIVDIEPANAYIVDDSITWNVSDPSVVTFSNDSVVYAQIIAANAGTATISATASNGVSASYEIKVNALEKIELGQSKELTLRKGEIAAFTFTPQTTGKYVFHMPEGKYHPEEQLLEDFNLEIYRDGKSAGEFVSTDSFAGSGYIGEYCTMEAGVEYTLIAFYPYVGNFDSITGTVSLDVLQEAISFSIKSSNRIYLGQRFGIDVENTLPENAYVIDTAWKVSDPSIASISYESDNYAEFVAVGEGSATITATAGNGVSASYEVEVTPVENWGELGSKTITLEGGESRYFSFVPKTSGKYVFTIPNTGADTEQLDVDVVKDGEYIAEAVFNSDSFGVYVEMEKGTEYLLMVTNYYNQKLTDTVTLGTYIAPKKLSFAVYEGTDNTLYPSEILHVGGACYAAVFTDPENTYAAGITLTSSDPSVLAVEGKGSGYYYMICAQKAGTVTITATAPNGAVGTKKITVKEGKLLPILEGANSTVAASKSLTVRIDGEMDKFEEVWAVGEKLDAKDYTVTKTEKGVKVTLSPEYLKTVKPGKHSLSIYFSNGWAATSFEVMTSMLGDVNGDGAVTDDDVTLLLWHTLFPEENEIVGDADYNHDGSVTDEDVTMLLWYTLFPEDYPLK